VGKRIAKQRTIPLTPVFDITPDILKEPGI
jgi:hypothetical protein